MSPRSRRVITGALFVAAAVALTGCGAVGSEPETEVPELSPQEQLEQDAGVTIEPGFATCAFNNEADDPNYDGLETVEIQETSDAYVVTYTGDFFDPDQLVTEQSSLNLQLIFSGQEVDEPSPTLMTTYYRGELDFTGTFEGLSQDAIEQETGAVVEDGIFTATYAKSSPHFEGFTPDSWVASVNFTPNVDDESIRSESVRCGDGRNWPWEPAA